MQKKLKLKKQILTQLSEPETKQVVGGTIWTFYCSRTCTANSCGAESCGGACGAVTNDPSCADTSCCRTVGF